MAVARGKSDMGKGQGGREGEGEGNKDGKVAMAREGKRAKTRAANVCNGGCAAIRVVVMVVVAFNGGSGNCDLCQQQRRGERVTWARVDKGARVRARADKGQGHSDNKKEGAGDRRLLLFIFIAVLFDPNLAAFP
jgi:hypothetical protein